MNIINIELPKKYKLDIDIENLSSIILAETLKMEKIKYDFSVNVSIVSDKKIKKINNLERGINEVTDVLSFPNIPFSKPSYIDEFIDEKSINVSIIDLNTNTIFLGDVVICYEKVLEQASLYNHSIEREFSFLLLHSFLHLLGYDHMAAKDEKIMFKKQDKVLNKLGIVR